MIVNAELIGVDKKGKKETVQMGAGTYFEAERVEALRGKGYDGYADIHLSNGVIIQGVGLDLFENHGTPQVEVFVGEELDNGQPEVSGIDEEEFFGEETDKGSEESDE